MPVGEAHGHVEIGDIRGGARVEDRHDETRIDRVEHVRRADAADERLDRGGIGRVDAFRPVAGVTDARDELRGPRLVVVGDRQGVEEGAACGDPSGSGTHSARADDEDVQGHGAAFQAVSGTRTGCRG